MFPLRGPSLTPRNGNARPAVRVPPPLFCVRGLLPTSPERRAVRPPRRSTFLQARFREGNVPDATAVRIWRRRPHRGRRQAQGWSQGSKATADHPHLGAEETVQSLVRGQSQTVQESAGSSRERNRPERARRAGLVSKPEGEDEKDPEEGETGRREVRPGEGKERQGREGHKAGVPQQRARALRETGRAGRFALSEIWPTPEPQHAVFSRR